MSKGLEALKRIRPYSDSTIDADLEIIEKELKVLDIIKHTLKEFIEFNVIELPHIHQVHYEIKLFDRTFYATKEEYELLNEVVK